MTYFTCRLRQCLRTSRYSDLFRTKSNPHTARAVIQASAASILLAHWPRTLVTRCRTIARGLTASGSPTREPRRVSGRVRLQGVLSGASRPNGSQFHVLTIKSTRRQDFRGCFQSRCCFSRDAKEPKLSPTGSATSMACHPNLGLTFANNHGTWILSAHDIKTPVL